MFTRLKEWYKSQPEMVRYSIWLGLILIIGIIIRWDFVRDGICRGFAYFSDK